MGLKEHDPRGIGGRIALLRQNVAKSIRDPEISRQLGLGITRACPWRDDRCELEAIWYFMHRNIRYTGDIQGYDTFQTARRTLQYRGGDCDDGFTLVTTLGLGNGFPMKGRITKNVAGGPWAHIYPLAGVPRNAPRVWVPLDWTLGYKHFGAHPPQASFLEFDGKLAKHGEIRPDEYEGW